jgi:hypothetical protein
LFESAVNFRKLKMNHSQTATTEGSLTLEKLSDEIRPILNDLCVICGGPEIVRLIGVRETPDDLYYISVDRLGERRYWSAVGHAESIRNGLSPAYYDSVERGFTLQGGSPVPLMVIERSILSRPDPCAASRAVKGSVKSVGFMAIF